MPAEALEIQVLGDFQIRCGERIIPERAWKLRKAAGIVKLLSLEPGYRLHREQILDTLWPELDPRAAANNFHYALHVARRTIDTDGFLYREGRHLILGAPETVWVDAQAFETAIATAWRNDDPGAYQSAVNLYAGDLLPADRYEEWLDARRTSLKTSYLAARSWLANHYQANDAGPAAIEAWLHIIAAEPTREEAHAQLMLLYARNGQQREALAQYDRLVAILDSELGVEPDRVTQQLAQAIRDGKVAETAPATTTKVGRSNLPAQTTALVGRERELAEARQALAGARLVTVTGPGGVGKTRLALEIAAEERENFSDGVVFVPLAPLDEPELVEMAVIHTRGIQQTPGQTPAETLAGFFRERSTLLVLDNFEHLVSAAPIITQLLEACPRLKVLATSRVTLRLRGEREYPLRSLVEDASATLFIHRARDVRPDFDPGQPQMAVITQICQRLDGLPLAIELAAARSKVLPPEALLARLEYPLTLLTSGPRDLPTRQQTLRGAIAWSYDFLQPAEQKLFRALAVFSGGWTLEAAEAVAPAEIDPLDGVTTLVESSLIEQRESGGEPRFRMLQTIREFGLEELAKDAGESAVRGRHARYFSDLVETAASFMHGPEQADWLDRLELDHANIRIALDWFAENDVPAGLHMVGPMWLFWWLRGHLAIGRSHYDALLARADEGAVDPITLGHALTGAGIMAEWLHDQERAIGLQEKALSIWLDCKDPPEGSFWPLISLGNMALMRSEIDTAEAHYRESLLFSRRHNLRYGEVSALLSLGNVASYQGNHERALELRNANLRMARAIGDSWSIGLGAGNLGLSLLAMGDHERARPYLEESIAINQQLRHNRDLASGIHCLGEIALKMGDVEEAGRRFEESYDLSYDIGNMIGIAAAKHGLAKVARKLGNHDDAIRLFQESLEASRRVGIGDAIAAAIEGLAAVSHDTGDSRRAALLLGCTTSFREQVSMPPTVSERAEIEQLLDQVRDALSPAEFSRAWSDGSRLSPDQIELEVVR